MSSNFYGKDILKFPSLPLTIKVFGIQLHFGEIATSTSKYKCPVKRDLYTVCKRTGLDQFTKSYGLTAKEFGENFDSGLVKHSLQSDPDSSPWKNWQKITSA